MSGRDDDVFDLDDLQRALCHVTGGVRSRPIAVGIALAVVAAGLALALVPHVFGAVGADAVDAGTGATPGADTGDGAQQRYQNYLTNLAFLFAPVLLPTVGVGIAFAGALRVRGTRAERVGVVAASAGVGVALAYAAFVGVGHLAFGEAADGYIVEEFPVTLQFGGLAVNALALGVLTSIGGALAGVAGTLVEPDPAAASTDGSAPAVSDATGDEATATADGGDGVTTAEDARDDDSDSVDGRDGGDGSEDTGTEPAERPARLDGTGPANDYRDDVEPAGDYRDDVGPASDYRDVDGQHDSRTPTYDPDGRDWDGSGEDSS